MTGKTAPKMVFEIEQFYERAALDILNEYSPNGKLGRPFEDGIMQIWYDLELDLGYVA